MKLLDQLVNLYKSVSLNYEGSCILFCTCQWGNGMAYKQRDNLGVFKILVDYVEEGNCTGIVFRFKSYVW